MAKGGDEQQMEYYRELRTAAWATAMTYSDVDGEIASVQLLYTHGIKYHTAQHIAGHGNNGTPSPLFIAVSRWWNRNRSPDMIGGWASFRLSGFEYTHGSMGPHMRMNVELEGFQRDPARSDTKEVCDE